MGMDFSDGMDKEALNITKGGKIMKREFRIILYGFLLTALSIGMSLMLSTVASAALVVNGTDSTGAKVIYDTDLNITWYDYADQNSSSLAWGSALSWAANLSVTVNGKVYTEWRLPSTIEGTGNINLGEMGHLYYDELKNSAGWLTNEGPFTNLLAGYDGYCWTSTPNTSTYWSDAWRFAFRSGNQASYSDYQGMRAFAVHDGNVGSPVPVPAAVWLLGSGLLGLVGVRRKLRRNLEDVL